MNIREFRKLRNLTQEDMAVKLGVTQGFIGQMERGESEPSGRLAKQIVALTDGLVTLDDLYPVKQEAA